MLRATIVLLGAVILTLAGGLVWATQRSDDISVERQERVTWHAIQVALGGWVSTNYAVLACTTFPTCQGSWWPAMDFAHPAVPRDSPLLAHVTYWLEPRS